MINHFWRLLAKLLARPAIADWIIARAMRTPYDHLIVCDGRIHRVSPIYPLEGQLSTGEHWYMRRWWLLRLGPLQVRVHHIMAEDIGRDLHDHPWPFRTFILAGGYIERREGVRPVWRKAGDTAAMGRGEFHRIAQVEQGGAWTLFCTWGERKGWGFKSQSGQVIPHQEYVQ